MVHTLTAAQFGALGAPSEPSLGPVSMVNVSASSSPSVAERVICFNVSSTAGTALAPVCGAATGAAFGGTTVMVKVCAGLVSTPPLAVPPLSVSFTETVLLPDRPAAGVYVRVPVAALPNLLAAAVKLNVPVPDTAGARENSVGFELPMMLKLTVWAASSEGPGEIAVAHGAEYAPESSKTVTVPPEVNVGASLTALT